MANFLFVFHYNFLPISYRSKVIKLFIMVGFAYKGRHFGGFGAGDPQNLKCGDCNPQKAYMWVIPSRLSVESFECLLRQNQSMGLARPWSREIKKKKKKISHTTSIFRHAMGAPPFIRTGPNLAVCSGPGPYHTCQFLPRSIKNWLCGATWKFAIFSVFSTTSAVALNTARDILAGMVMTTKLLNTCYKRR